MKRWSANRFNLSRVGSNPNGGSYLLLDIFHNEENYGGSRIYQTTPGVAVADRGGKGAVKISYKKIDFMFPVPLSPGHWIRYWVETPTQINVWPICHQNCMKMKKTLTEWGCSPILPLKERPEVKGFNTHWVTFCYWFLHIKTLMPILALLPTLCIKETRPSQVNFEDDRLSRYCNKLLVPLVLVIFMTQSLYKYSAVSSCLLSPKLLK